uniref:MAM domain-containing protein n=1 Tax=Parascaris univalens TaxID=6257 RepID=A0A915BIE3_PARUN
KAWQVAEYSPPSGKMFNATGTFIVPNAPFAYLYIEQDRHAPFNMLRSDPIACQAEEESRFSFRYWATRDVMIEVCATSINETELECHLGAITNSPALANFSFKRHESFTITIKVKSVNSDYDNFIAIDDIVYRAVMCFEAIDAWDLGTDFYSVPMLSALLHRPIFSSKDLDCSFDRRAIDCLWAGEEGANPTWMIASTPLNKHKLQSLTGTDQMPDGEFAFVRLDEGETANLITEAIRCVTNEAMLTFRFWQTGAARLSVCLLEDKMPEVIDCQTISLQQPGPAVVDVPNMSHSFRIAFRAEAKSKGIIIIDDITMEGDICPSSLRQHGVRTAQLRTIEAPDPNVCRLLTCKFIGGQMCLYRSGRVALSQSSFHPRNGSVIASLFSKGKMAVLESPPFTLNTAARVHFAYQKQTGISSLFVCQDSVTQELEKCFEVGSNQTGTTWTQDFMEILPSDTKFYVFAKLRDGSRR